MEKANEIINSMFEQLVTLQTILDGRDDWVKDKPVERRLLSTVMYSIRLRRGQVKR